MTYLNQYQQPPQQPTQQYQQPPGMPQHGYAGGYQHPQQAQQQYQQYQQPQQPPPAMPQHGYAGGYPNQAPQQPAGPPPVMNMNEEAAQAALKASEESFAAKTSMGDPFPNWLKFPGPEGQTKWDHSVPVGYAAHLDLYICPPWTDSVALPFLESVTHFYKSHPNPKGTVVTCTDDKTCLFCQARSAGLESVDVNVNRTATMWGKKRRQFIYNVLDLNNPNSHVYKDGKMRPLLLGASVTLQKALRKIFEVRGVTQICDWQNFKPIRITKKKTGPQDIDIEYSAIDLEPIALPDMFYPALHAIWDLAEQVKPSAPNEIMQAIQELGLPLPGSAQQPHQTAAYNPMPAPPPQQYQSPPAYAGVSPTPAQAYSGAAPGGVQAPPPPPPASAPPQYGGRSAVPPQYGAQVPPAVNQQASQQGAPAVPPLPSSQEGGAQPPLPQLPAQSQGGAGGGTNAAMPGGQVIPPPPGARSF